MTQQTCLAWGDEMRVGLYGQTRRVWAPRGVKIRQRVQIEREWRYLALAVVPLTGQLSWCWMENLKTESVVWTVEHWRQEGIEGVVLDRASGHRGAQAAHPGMIWIFQPPYSPELNPVERVFEELRRAIEGRPYGCVEEKVARVEEELRRWAADPGRVRRLTGWPWIQEAWAHLPSGDDGRLADQRALFSS